MSVCVYVFVCVCVIIPGFSAAQAGHRVTGQQVLLVVCFDRGSSEGQGLHSGSSLVILCVSQQPFEKHD